MKKLYLLLFLLFTMGFAFGQGCPVNQTFDIVSTTSCSVLEDLPLPSSAYDTVWYSYTGPTSGSGIHLYGGTDPSILWSRGVYDIRLLVDTSVAGGDTCTYNITVQDASSPQPNGICGEIFTVYLDDDGDVMVDTVTAVLDQVLDSVTDNCFADAYLDVSFGDKEFVCADTTPVGMTHTVTLTVEDSVGNFFECDVHFEVKDSTSPIVLCDVDTVYLDSMGMVSLTTANLDNGSSDNCGIDSMWLSAYDLGCDFVGDTTVMLTARDGSGNTGTCSNTITVVDTIAPMIFCVDTVTKYLDRDGQTEVLLADVVDSVWENTCLANIDTVLSDTFFYCAVDNYDSLITVTVYDHDSLIGTCNSLIQVRDTISPEAFCMDDTVYVDRNGDAFITWMNVLDSAWDNCSLIDTTINGLDTIFFSCDQANGDSIITVEVTDHVLLTGSCDATVTVLDTIKPEVFCKPDTVYLDTDGDAFVTWMNILDSAWDNCSLVDTVLWYDIQSGDTIWFDCNDADSVRQVTIQVIDHVMLDSNCVANVTILDTIAPTVVCQDIDVYLDNTTGAGSVTITDADLVDTTTENCTIVDTTATQYTFDCDDLGTVLDTVVVTDHVGLTGSCVATVTVIDTFPPTMVCDNDLILFLDANGIAVIDSNALDMGSYDNCAIVMFEMSRDTFDCTFVNKTDAEVTMTATDTYGLTSDCTANVSVNDTIHPEAKCKDITVWLDASGAATITPADVDNGSTDNAILCGIDTVIDVSSFGCDDLFVNVGTIPVTLTVIDVADSTDACISNVTVLDTMAPTVTCMNDTVYLDATGNASIVDADLVALAGDNCSIVDTTLTKYDFDCSNVGNNLDTVTVTDNGGLTATCVATVTVIDTVPPVALCQPATLYLDENGYVWLDDALIDNGSTDACGIDTMYLDNDDFYCTDLGDTNQVVLTVVDVNGNESTCTATVNVKDEYNPYVDCKEAPVYVYLDGSAPGLNGSASVTVAMMIDSMSDNCSIETTDVTPSVFDCGDIGPNPVTVTVTDQSGNPTSCDATVYVKDLMDPVIVCNELSVELWDNGEYVLDAEERADLIEGSWDNCTDLVFGDFDFYVPSYSFECVNDEDATNYVPAKVRVIVADEHNNIDTAYCPVEVKDVTPPVAVCRDTSVVLDEDGHGLIFPGWINAGNDRESVPEWARTYNDLEGGSWDACGIADAELSKASFTCADIGPNTVTLTVIDPSGHEDQCTSTVTVIDDIAPVVTPVADVAVEVVPGVCETLIANYPAIVATDICGVTIDSSGAIGFDGMFPLGTTTETYVITDGGGNSETLTFDVTVTTYNGAPTIDAINDVEINEDNASTVSLSGITPGVDCDSQTVVSVTAVADDPALITSVTVNYTPGEETGSIQIEVAPDASGSSVITVTVMDDGGTDGDGVDTTVETFTITVVPVNDAPVVVGPIDDVDVNAAKTAVVPVPATLGQIFDDVDGDALTVTATLSNGDPLPGWITLANDALTISPLIEDTGCVVVAVTATDPGGLFATDEFEVCALGYPVGYETLQNDFKVNMYPNPTRDRVTLEIDGNIGGEVMVSVTNITGKEIYRKEFLSTKLIELDMSRHVSGMYFVRLDVDGNEVVKKLIVNRK